MSLKKKCNKDCFNCIFDDCILNDEESLNYEMYLTTDKIDKEIVTKEKKYSNIYYANNRRKRLDYQKQYNKLNSHKIAIYKANWRQKNIEKERLRLKLYHELNKTRVRMCHKQWYEKNKEKQ